MLRSCLLTTFVGTAASLVATTSGLLLGSFHSHQTASPSRRTNTIMRAKSNSNNSKDKAVIDLQLHTIRQSPAETLVSLSEACNTLGVESFDVYGDYQSNPLNLICVSLSPR